MSNNDDSRNIIHKEDYEYSEDDFNYMEQTENEKKEFLEREKKVADWYMENYLPYWNSKIEYWESNWFSYGEIDSDILIKACQNDIRMILNKFGEWFKWEMKIIYKSWCVQYMKIQIESIENNSSEEDYKLMKEYVWDYWYVTHQRYWTKSKKLIGEKIFRYSDEERAVLEENSWLSNPTTKKVWKKNNL